uniref:cyclin-dependent kinase inhibitor 3 family protein n=1 Tax=Cellvibrio fontiphilus TaxID=1815559 RepID=UPI002B4BC2C1|nr:cyclin-dependent kinase inhibitor 3 family protein [Cellvibrio fontiphilus]
MNHPFDILPLDNGAAFIFTPCPGTKQVELKTSLEQLAAAGATAVLTLMENEEMERNKVTDLPHLCAELNLQWFHLPIEDDHAPEQEFAVAWQVASKKIHALLDSGKTIAIHCKGGSGRTGLVAAQILIERGMPLDTVTEQIRALRPNSLQVPAQQTYIKTIAGN